ncbi:MAG: oxidoreductase [Acidobacteria bacterium]|nr:oxidoreductase [Acidobacteriota bacterium]
MSGTTFKALLLSEPGDAPPAWEIAELGDDDLPEGDTVVDVEYSTVNFKDGLAITNRSPIVRDWPMVPGIDLAGVVVSTDTNTVAVGDRVVLNGWGVGESHWGGLSQRARVNAEWLVGLPDAISTRTAMAIGTAGYTAMLCVLALEEHGVVPASGPVVVTGAAGGVGSTAVAILSSLGYEVHASTGRSAEADYLRGLGAAEIIDRAELSEPSKRPLVKGRWAGAVDAVGSHTLANVLAATLDNGCVAACGLAQGMDLATSVAPFILRGVTLAGVNSVSVPLARRELCWQRLGTDLPGGALDEITSEVALDEVPSVAERILDGAVRGRVVVDVHA